MNKTELIAAVAEKTNLTKKDSQKAVNAMLETITEELAKEEKVTLVGFGTFEVRHRVERQGRNPATKEVITIPASKSPAFKAGKNLKDRVNE
ncbi:MAG: HU family DNA-binding protein [Clostridiaceae bacterium]|nr:HU family DNA-binding protein [Clostridiaceae bacterium]